MRNRIYRIGITGHRPFKFKDPETAKEICEETVKTIASQYGEENLIFNVGGCIGADQWVARACIEQEVNYHLYLPFPPEIQSQYWYDAQKKELSDQIEHAYGLTTIGFEYRKENYFIRDKAIVDNSDFVVAFWEGAYSGTRDTIEYAIHNNKMVLNAMANLSMVTKDHLKKRKKGE